MTDHLSKWWKVGGLLGNIHTVAYVTSTEWGEIAKEVDALQPEAVVRRPTNKNFVDVKLGENLIVRNSGTEDQDVVNQMNVLELGEKNMRLLKFRRDNFITGKA